MSAKVVAWGLIVLSALLLIAFAVFSTLGIWTGDMRWGNSAVLAFMLGLATGIGGGIAKGSVSA